MLHVLSKTTMYGILAGLFIAIHYIHTLGMEIREEKDFEVFLGEMDENTPRTLGFTIINDDIRRLLIGSDKYKDNSTNDTPGTFTVTDLQDYHYSMKYTINGDDSKLAENLLEIWNVFAWKENTTRTICCRSNKIDNAHIRRLLNGSDKYKVKSTNDTPGFFDVTGLQEYHTRRKYAINGVDSKLAGYISKSWNAQITYSERSPKGIAGFIKEHSLYPSSIHIHINRYRHNGNDLFQNYVYFSSEDWSDFLRKYDMARLMYNGEITLSSEYVWHPNTYCVDGKDNNEPMFETSPGLYGRICHVSSLALKMLNKLHILDHAIRTGVLAINKFEGVLWMFALLWIIWKQKVDPLETTEHQRKALPDALNKTTSLQHKGSFQQKKKIENDKRIMEINEQILSILHHLDNEMNIRETKQPHSSV